MRARKFMAAAVAATLLGFGLASVAHAEDFDRLRGVVAPVKAKKPYRIGWAAIHFVDTFWVSTAYGLVDEAKQAGVDLVRILPAGGYGNLAEQQATLDQLAALNLDAILISGVTYQGFDRAVKRITDRGIKVAVLGTPVDAKTVSFGVVEDQADDGIRSGQYLCSIAKNAKVVSIPGPAGAEWNKMRYDAFKKEAEKCGTQVLGGTYQGGMGLEDGRKQAEDLMVKYPDAHYIWTIAGNIGDGAAEAIERTGRKDIWVIGSGFTANTAKMMKEGYIKMYLSEPAILSGRLAVQYVTRLLNGDQMPNLVNGLVPYPAVVIPTPPVEGATIAGYNLEQYDQAPAGWSVPLTK
ncbi:MAG TPA: substrate-binding domain-containing protein [Magnetospirillaceae bacterium]|jgi:ribose transport system substrate-binding protein